MSSKNPTRLWKNKYKAISGINISIADSEARGQIKEAKGLSEDTILRKELQEQILKFAKNGESVSEIVEKLNKMDKFAKFAPFFVEYTENRVKKYNIAKKQKENDSNER